MRNVEIKGRSKNVAAYVHVILNHKEQIYFGSNKKKQF